jgi:N-acetylglutamate synthase-like GNAT family acetyltransferase
MRIRRATADDTQRARTIVEEYNESIGVVKRDDATHFDQYVSSPNAFWLAEIDHESAGCVALRPLPEVHGRACEVKRLYVRPAYRRAGVAAELMDAVEAYALEVGYDAIYLDTFDALADAVRFYERRGYERIQRYNENPQATIFMRKALR